jgi:hypothetical protein
MKYLIYSSALGLLISGIQLIPFTEYLLNSYAIVKRGSEAAGQLVPLKAFVYNLFPNLTGNPSTNFYRQLAQNAGYHTVTAAYVGPIVTFLSVLTILYSRKIKRHTLFFLLLSLFSLPFIYDVPIFNNFSRIANTYSANQRLLFTLGLTQTVLVAAFFENIKDFKFLKKLLNKLVIFLPIAAALLLILLNFVPEYIPTGIREEKLRAFIGYQKGQILFLASTTFVGLLFIQRLVSKKHINLYLVFISVLVFMQTGLLNIDYNPSIDEKYFYPETKAIETLKKLPKNNSIQLGGNHIIHPDINLLYEVGSVENYDAMDIKDYRFLFENVFDNREEWNDTIIDTNQNYLNLFGVRYVLSYTDIENTIVVEQADAQKFPDSLKRKKSLETGFDAAEDGLYAVRVLPANFNRDNQCVIKIYIADDKDIIYEELIDCEHFFDKIYYQFDFPTINKSRVDAFTLGVEFIEGEDDISFWTNNDGELVLQSIYKKVSKPYLDKIYDGSFNIYENKSFKGDFYFLDDIKYVDRDVILDYIKEDEFDTYSQVLLESNNFESSGVKNNQNDENYDIGIIDEDSTKTTVYANSESDGLIVTSRAYYPGWKALVDGESVDLIKANGAFIAIPVTSGEHLITLYYDPASLKAGYIMTAAGVLLLLAQSIKHNLYGKGKKTP